MEEEAEAEYDLSAIYQQRRRVRERVSEFHESVEWSPIYSRSTRSHGSRQTPRLACSLRPQHESDAEDRRRESRTP